jgi:hypothetical protein
MERKISVIVTILLAGVILCLHSSFRGLHDQIHMLSNTSEELQNSLNTLPFIHVGRAYLDGVGKTPGKILSIHLEEKAPISWQNYTEIDIARAKETGEILPPYVLGEPRLCWVIQFEQAQRPSHYFGVWIDASTSNVIGIQECRANGRLMG